MRVAGRARRDLSPTRKVRQTAPHSPSSGRPVSLPIGARAGIKRLLCAAPNGVQIMIY